MHKVQYLPLSIHKIQNNVSRITLLQKPETSEHLDNGRKGKTRTRWNSVHSEKLLFFKCGQEINTNIRVLVYV